MTVNRQFDNKIKYKVWLNIYEGLLGVSSKQTKTFETTTVEKEKVQFIFCMFVYYCMLKTTDPQNCAVHIKLEHHHIINFSRSQ